MGKSTQVIILGCHRSGTSLVAGILHKLGVDMGDNLMGANLGNPLGYFEDAEFYRMNEKILEIAGGSWHSPPDPDELRFIQDKYSELNNKIKKLVDKKDEGLWGWKDPRTSITIEMYLSYLDNPKFVVVNRPDDEILKSFKTRDGHNVYGNQEMIDTYKERTEEFFNNHDFPKLEVEYSKLIKNPDKELKRIAKFVGVKPNKEAREMIKSREEIKELRDEFRQSEADKYEEGAYHWRYYKEDPFYRLHVDFIVDKFRNKEGLLLDVGCGDGLISSLLSRNLNVTGIDICERAIELAKQKNKVVQYEVRDVFDMSGGFDYLLASEVIEHIPDPEAFLKKIKTLFSKEALITTPNKEVSEQKDPHHFREFNKEEFKTLLEQYFNEVQVDKKGFSLYGFVK